MAVPVVRRHWSLYLLDRDFFDRAVGLDRGALSTAQNTLIFSHFDCDL